VQIDPIGMNDASDCDDRFLWPQVSAFRRPGCPVRNRIAARRPLAAIRGNGSETPDCTIIANHITFGAARPKTVADRFIRTRPSAILWARICLLKAGAIHNAFFRGHKQPTEWIGLAAGTDASLGDM